MAEASQSLDSNLSLTAGSEVTFDIVCTPCDNDGDINEAKSYCHDCKEYLCTTCLKYHNKLAGSRHHTLVEKNNLPGTRGTLPVNDICMQRCQTHQDQVIQFFCPSHKKLGCGVCMISIHDTCKGKIHIPDKAKTLTEDEEFKSFQTLLEKLRKSSDIVIKTLHANIESSAVYRVAALQEIETFRREINVALDEMKAALEKQIQDITSRDEEAMNSVTEKANTIKTALQQMSSVFDTLLSKGHHCQMFIEMKSNEDKLADLQRQLEEAETSCITAFKFQPNDDLQKLVTRKDALGQLLVMKPEEMSANHIDCINVKATDDKAKCWANGASLLSMDKLVVADWNNNSIKLVDTVLKRVIAEYKPEQAPSDVTSININQFAVTLPAAKKILIMNSETKLTLQREIDVNQQCYYIAYIDDNLVVSVNDPHEVRILSLTGATLKTFSTSSTEERLFSSVPRVTVSSFTRTIYATDWEENCVTMLDMDGNVIAHYKDDNLKYPDYSAVDDMGMVYVCGTKSNNIHLLTPYCSKVRILLTERDGINMPRSVCYCKHTRRIYVGLSPNDIVKVYQLS